MRSAISRYGARVLPDTQQIAAACKARGEYIQGPQIAEFERAFERRAGSGTAITAAYGRIAFYYMLITSATYQYGHISFLPTRHQPRMQLR